MRRLLSLPHTLTYPNTVHACRVAAASSSPHAKQQGTESAQPGASWRTSLVMHGARGSARFEHLSVTFLLAFVGSSYNANCLHHYNTSDNKSANHSYHNESYNASRQACRIWGGRDRHGRTCNTTKVRLLSQVTTLGFAPGGQVYLWCSAGHSKL